MFGSRFLRLFVVVLATCAAAFTALPASAATDRVVVVDGSAAAASDGAAGTQDQPVRTIAAGLRLAQQHNRSGAAVTVRVRGGVYREALELGRPAGATDAPITIEGAPGEQVAVAGSDVWTAWTPAGEGLSTHAWPHDWGLAAIPSGWENLFAERNYSPLIRRRELVAVNGAVLRQVLTRDELRATPGAFLVDEAADLLTLHLPADVAVDTAVVEVAVRGRLLNVAHRSNVTLRNLEFRHATQSFQQAAVRLDSSTDIRVEDSRFVWNNWAGLQILKSQRVSVMRSSADHNGVLGITSFRSGSLLLVSSTTDANNWRGDWVGFRGWDAGGAKFYATRGATLRDHRSVGNFAHGIWFDTDNTDVRVERSYVAGNTGHGTFFEASQGPFALVDSVLCRNGIDGLYNGWANDVTVGGNRIFGNGQMQVLFSGDPGGRRFTSYDSGQQHEIHSTGWLMRGNVIATEAPGQLIYRVRQAAADWEHIRSTITADANTYASPGNPQPFQLSNGQKVDLAGWRSHTGDDRSSSATQSLEEPLRCEAPAPTDARPAPPVTPDPTTPPTTGGATAPVATPVPATAPSGAQPAAGPTAPASTPSTDPSDPGAGPGTSRLAGPDRVSTALSVAESLSESPDTVIVVPAGTHSEALIAAPLAAAAGAPVLLTDTAALSPSVAERIRSLGAERAYVIGAPDRLAPQIEADLAAAGVTTVIRLAAEDRYALAARVAREVHLLATSQPSTRVLLALGEGADPSRDWPDALSAGALAAQVRAPVLLTRGTELPASVAAVLAELRPELVQVVGGSAAITDEVAAAAAAAAGGARLERLAGATRYGTSVAVAQEGIAAGLDAGAVWIATGTAFPDALAAGPAAAAAGAPLLLVHGGQVGGAPESEAWLAAEGARLQSATILGGTAAVSAAVEAEVAALVAADPSPR